MTTKETRFLQKPQLPVTKHSNSVKSSKFFNLNLNRSFKNSNHDLSLQPLNKTKCHKFSAESQQHFSHVTGITVSDKCHEKQSVNFKTSKNLWLNDETEEDKGKQKRWINESSNKKNCSTLSLHIAAYEKSFEDTASNKPEIDSLKKTAILKLVKPSSNFQDSFEFPRSRKDKKRAAPEIQQFKASQKLFSPNQAAVASSSNQIQSPSLTMSSRGGARPAGTDGMDFQHRQRVAAQYQTSAQYKFYLKALFGLHFFVLIALWSKVFGEIAVTHLGVKSAFWTRMDLPSAYPWEYVWCFSIIPIVLGLYAMPKNRVKPMTYAYYGQFFTGILPCSLGLGSQFPELISYIADPVANETPTIKGSFPMVVIWFIFFLIAFQLHIFAMYFKYYLLAAWNPLPVTAPTSNEAVPAEEKDKKEKKSD